MAWKVHKGMPSWILLTHFLTHMWSHCRTKSESADDAAVAPLVGKLINNLFLYSPSATNPLRQRAVTLMTADQIGAAFDNPIGCEDLACTIYDALGIDPHAPLLRDKQGRPVASSMAAECCPN